MKFKTTHFMMIFNETHGTIVVCFGLGKYWVWFSKRSGFWVKLSILTFGFTWDPNRELFYFILFRHWLIQLQSIDGRWKPVSLDQCLCASVHVWEIQRLSVPCKSTRCPTTTCLPLLLTAWPVAQRQRKRKEKRNNRQGKGKEVGGNKRSGWCKEEWKKTDVSERRGGRKDQRWGQVCC